MNTGRKVQNMAKRSFIGGLLTFTAAAATVAGLCYAFKDEIRGSKPYQDLNDRYDVNSKLDKASAKAKKTAADLKGKAASLKEKVVNTPSSAEDDDVLEAAEDEADRDYVAIQPEGEEEDASDDAGESETPAETPAKEDKSADSSKDVQNIEVE